MTNSRKRPAESAAVSTPVATATSSKKRKLDNVQKYYAVRAGRRPGIYLTYPECQAQTAGFKGAVFKSFISREDAEAFAAGKKVAAAADEPEKWYAVAVGNPTGIFRDWNEAALSIKGVKGPKYRKFSTRSEAVAYIKEHGDQDTIEALGETAQPSDKLGKRVKTSAAPPGAAPETTSTSNDILNIYTDGSSLSNGKVGARAGVGVYFGDDDPRNVAEPLDGDLQTNQRAELQAMVRALEIAPANQNVRILTDSKYSINCVTQWATGWKKKGWKTAQGEEVKNQDLIRAVLDNMKLREDAGAHTYFQWVRGHASDKGNIAADRLAVRGASMG